MNTPELETERLRLRRFTAEDAAAILAIFGDVEANTFLPWFPLKSLEEARQLFERQYQPVYRAERGYQYAICLKEDDIPIGYVKVDLDESHDLGYGLRHEFWHRGIAAEAARALVEQVRRDGLPYLTATHDVNNPNSGAVMKKLGMSINTPMRSSGSPRTSWCCSGSTRWIWTGIAAGHTSNTGSNPGSIWWSRAYSRAGILCLQKVHRDDMISP